MLYLLKPNTTIRMGVNHCVDTGHVPLFFEVDETTTNCLLPIASDCENKNVSEQLKFKKKSAVSRSY